jgi:hypothetical protein
MRDIFRVDEAGSVVFPVAEGGDPTCLRTLTLLKMGGNGNLPER